MVNDRVCTCCAVSPVAATIARMRRRSSRQQALARDACTAASHGAGAAALVRIVEGDRQALGLALRLAVSHDAGTRQQIVAVVRAALRIVSDIPEPA